MKAQAFRYGFSRRDLMQAAGTATLLSAASLLGLQQALAKARSTGKPLLTAASIDALLAQNPDLLKEYAADPRQFLMNSFSLTPAQQSALASFTSAEVAQVQTAVRFATSHNLPVVHECARTAAAPGATLMAQTPRLSIVSTGQAAAVAGRPLPAPGSRPQAAVIVGATL